MFNYIYTTYIYNNKKWMGVYDRNGIIIYGICYKYKNKKAKLKSKNITYNNWCNSDYIYSFIEFYIK